MLQICLLLLAGVASASDTTYFITTPKVYFAGNNAKIVVNIINLTKNASIKVELDKTSTTINLSPSDGESPILHVVEFPVPIHLQPGEEQLTIIGSGGLNFTETSSIEIVKAKHNILIQTDKPMYKPGSDVQFRVIVIDKYLKPAVDPIVTEINIKNPSGSRISQWKNVTLNNGIISLNMKLSEQPVLGDWKIAAVYKDVDETQKITVKKYVLPKFEVQIKPPSYVLVPTSSIPITICAKYTYGKPVVGNVKASICLEFQRDWFNTHIPKECVEVNKKINGCADLTFAFDKEISYSPRIKIDATVVENGTEVTISAASWQAPDFTDKSLKVSFDVPRSFKPGFPFVGKLLVSTPDGRPALISLFNLTISDDKETTSTVVTVVNGVYQFTVDAVSTESYRIQAHYIEKDFFSLSQNKHKPKTKGKTNIYAFARVYKWQSNSKVFVKITNTTTNMNGLVEVDVAVKGLINGNSLLTSVLVCRGKVTWVDETQLKPKTILIFKVEKGMSPKCRLMVYTLLSDGEFIADHKTLRFDESTENQVSLRFVESETKPGESVELILKASPGSTMALSAVDKSVLLLGKMNDITNKQVNDYLSSQDVGASGNKQRRKKCEFYGYYEDEVDDDSRTSIVETGMIYFSNGKVDLLRCSGPIAFSVMESDEVMQYADITPRTESNEKTVSEKPLKVRRNFAETWFWFEENFDNVTNEKRIIEKIPDTITTWHVSGFAMSPTDGISVADPTSVKSFLPFFVSLSLPYSVIRGESVKLPTAVFNYLEKCLVIELLLKPSDEFVIVGNSLTKLCVCGGKSKTFKFAIKPSKLGKVDVNVQAISIAPDQTVCTSNEIMESLAASDAVNKKLLVEPEGIKKEEAISSYICRERDDEGFTYDTLKLNIPDKIVPDSLSTMISVVGDLMGPTMDGLDKLLKMPYGCGEQNMINFAPNIYVMDYLTATGQVTGKIKSKATRFMESGYQRELTYRHTDGAYSAFGTGEGSTWLTAFVLRSYSQAQKYIFIDEDEISISKKWLLNLQMDNGCFEEKGMIHHKEMKGGVSGQVTMTAFVLAALLEAKIPKDDGRIKKAVTCMTNGIRDITDSMHLAIVGYSLSLAESPKQLEVLEKLISLAKTDDGLMHWEAVKTDQPSTTHSYYRQSRSVDIEMTAYALMMYINAKPTDKREHLKIVQWLAKQRNAYGGFSSTQDTCVGLQALSKYTSSGFTGRHALTVRTEHEESNLFNVTNDNKMVLQRYFSDQRIDGIRVVATGQGCALVQLSVKYNVETVPTEPSFSLRVNVLDENTMTCKHKLSICSSYLKGVQSNMALIDVTMVSGFEPILNDLDIQTQSTNSSLERYEFKDGVLTLYFEQVKKVSSCVTTYIEQVNEVDNRKPATVKIYDYYDGDDQATDFYEVGKCPEINIVA